MNLLKKEEIYPFLLKTVEKAKKYILISSPWVKLDVLKTLIKDVDIEIIIRASQLEDLLITDKDIFKFLKQKNGKIYINPDIHAKFFIVDGEIAVVGSANITNAGLLEDGNIETAVVLKDKKEIKKLEGYFFEIASKSIDIFSDIAGIVLNALNGRTAEGLLFEKVPEESYIKIPINSKAFYLGRISNIKNISTTLFSSFATVLSRGIFSDYEKLKSIFEEKDDIWKRAAIFAYINEKSQNLSLCNIEVLAEFNPEKIKEKESILKTPIVPPTPGSPFFILRDKKEISEILKINHSGYPMGKPVPFGKLFNTDLKAFLDLEKIYTMHMAVLGTTGSGKTTFVRRLLENIKDREIKIFIFDLYGEYYGFLENRQTVKEIKIPNTIFPISAQQIKELMKDYSIPVQEKSFEEKKFVSFFRLALKPDINFIAFKEKSLEELFIEASQFIDIYTPLKNEFFLFLDLIKEDFGEDAVNNQPDILKKIVSSFTQKESITVFNLKEVEDPKSRINIAGLIMKEIFKQAKIDRKKRIVILEEAQNFAPEKGYGEIEAGSENLSFLMARKIATEGRKFNLGLVAITQRPANISKYILSQLNTQVIFKLSNRNDLEAVSPFFEFSKGDIFSILPFLKPGNGYITGLAVPFGMFIEIKLG